MTLAAVLALCCILALLSLVIAAWMTAVERARLMRIAGPLLLVAIAVPSLAMNHVFTGIGFAAAAVGLGVWMARHPRETAQEARVRSAGLELILDPLSGRMDGIVLAGRYDGHRLADLDAQALTWLYLELALDGEGQALLETYLERRLPGWRLDAQAQPGGRLGRAPAAGAMTEEEAYQILGLRSGSGQAEIRQAHRRLMKRVKPKPGASGLLAARVDEAKDILLRRH